MRQKHWRLRFRKPCYHGESGMAKRNSKELQEHGRTGWRSRSSKKHLIVSPMCPRPFGDSGLPCPSDSRETMVERSLFRTQPPPKGWPVLSGGSRNDGLGAGSRITNATDFWPAWSSQGNLATHQAKPRMRSVQSSISGRSGRSNGRACRQGIHTTVRYAGICNPSNC
jgi:hypothetical protein